MINGNRKHDKAFINLVEVSSSRLSSCLFDVSLRAKRKLFAPLSCKSLRIFTYYNSKRNFISVQNERSDTALAILYSLKGCMELQVQLHGANFDRNKISFRLTKYHSVFNQNKVSSCKKIIMYNIWVNE